LALLFDDVEQFGRHAQPAWSRRSQYGIDPPEFALFSAKFP